MVKNGGGYRTFLEKACSELRREQEGHWDRRGNQTQIREKELIKEEGRKIWGRWRGLCLQRLEKRTFLLLRYYSEEDRARHTEEPAGSVVQ